MAHRSVDCGELYGITDSQFVQLWLRERYSVTVEIRGTEGGDASLVPDFPQAEFELVVAHGGTGGLAVPAVAVLVCRVVVRYQFQVYRERGRAGELEREREV